MHAAIATPLTLLLAAVVTLGTTSLRTELWWIFASVIALCVALDAWLGRLSRYPSRFPLHPAGALIATFLVWPVSLPWYLHTKWRIRTGRLREDSPRQSQGCAYALTIAIGIGVTYAAITSIAQRPLLRDLQGVARAVQAVSPAPLNISITNGSNLVLAVETVPALPADSLRSLARRLATVAYFSFRDSSRLNSVSVSFRSVTKNGMLTVTRSGPLFEWWPQELDSTRGRAVVPN